MKPRRAGTAKACLLTLALIGCGRAGGDPSTFLLYNAAAIARPMRAVLDSFAARTGVRYEQETASSLELARKALHLAGQPDVIVLADPDVFVELLTPDIVTWHALFARNRIVLAFTDRSRHASEITANNWWQVVQRAGVEVGRSDPNMDPSGYRALLVWQLAERFYNQPDLAARLLANSPSRNVRPREAEQIAMIEAGEYDYTWTYENLAKNKNLRYVRLPSAIDLGSPDDSTNYATAKIRVQGRGPNDSVTFQGKPILFAVSIPTNARQREIAGQFVQFLLSIDGRRILRAQHFDAMDTVLFRGSEVPLVLGRGK